MRNKFSLPNFSEWNSLREPDWFINNFLTWRQICIILVSFERKMNALYKRVKIKISWKVSVWLVLEGRVTFLHYTTLIHCTPVCQVQSQRFSSLGNVFQNKCKELLLPFPVLHVAAADTSPLPPHTHTHIHKTTTTVYYKGLEQLSKRSNVFAWWSTSSSLFPSTGDALQNDPAYECFWLTWKLWVCNDQCRQKLLTLQLCNFALWNYSLSFTCYTTFSDLDHITGSQEHKAVLIENVLTQLSWKFIESLCTSSRSWVYHVFWWSHIFRGNKWLFSLCKRTPPPKKKKKKRAFSWTPLKQDLSNFAWL